MCGFFGCFHNRNFSITKDSFVNVFEAIKHRGPDASGYKEFILHENIIRFSHHRLSIIDLRDIAAQPFASYDNRFFLVYNGEIYNHNKLRKLINSKININWKTNCDTETLVNIFHYTNTKNAIKMLEGMFSFVLYDKEKNELILARDRVGEKPLYICTNNNYFSFASDLHPIKKLPYFNNQIDKKSLEEFLKYNYIPSPLSIYKNSFKIPPASFIKINLNKFLIKPYNNFNDFINSEGVEFDSWWSLNDNELKKNSNIVSVVELEKLLTNSVEKQLISDVPIGAFLSGGIDSSLIVSLMQKISGNTNTFTIGFDFAEFDESKMADSIAKILGTNHTTYICTQDDVISKIPNIPYAFTEPFADSSQIPTMLVSELASKKVKVVLSGDGGDELFGGYNRYIYANKYWKLFSLMPNYLRKKLISGLKFYPSKNLLYFFYKFFKNQKNINYKYQLEKILTKLLNITDENSYYRSLTQEWTDGSEIIKFNNVNNLYEKFFDKNNNLQFEEKMMYLDFHNYLTDDILCKLDRSSMYSSLETRVPFLDKEVIESAFNLPLNKKIHQGKSKIILKDILSKYLPEELINKEKRGFALPIASWMRSDLKDWVNDILSKEICNRHNLFNYSIIEKTIHEHCSLNINHEHKLWSLLQFNNWFINFHLK